MDQSTFRTAFSAEYCTTFARKTKEAAGEQLLLFKRGIGIRDLYGHQGDSRN
jgi:hypothetical protein